MDKSRLLGTWRLKSHTVTTANGGRSTPYGDSPKGYLTYSADGRMQVIGVASDRNVAAGTTSAHDERIALYDTMFAYGGTFSVEGRRIIHHVDIAWNESWTGTDQIRDFELSDDLLTLTTDIEDPVTGMKNRYAVVWEKWSG